MSTFSRDIGIEDIFTDAKYGVEVVVKKINNNVVLLQETESGNNRLCGREEFSEDKNRFNPK